MMARYFAKKAQCIHGHTHASKREAVRCVELHMMLQSGAISALVYEPQYWFEIDGHPVKLSNGRRAGYKPDFSYLEGNKVVVEDVKASNGFTDRDFPLRAAIFRHLNPGVELRVIR